MRPEKRKHLENVNQGYHAERGNQWLVRLDVQFLLAPMLRVGVKIQPRYILRATRDAMRPEKRKHLEDVNQGYHAERGNQWLVWLAAQLPSSHAPRGSQYAAAQIHKHSARNNR